MKKQGIVYIVPVVCLIALLAVALYQNASHVYASGKIQSISPSLTCKNAPCVLKNVQASAVSHAPVNDNRLASNPNNTKQLLIGAYDSVCLQSVGIHTSNDGGSTWSHSCFSPFGNQQIVPSVPGVSYDLSGAAYVAEDSLPRTGNYPAGTIIFQKSLNNGRVWMPSAVAVTGQPAQNSLLAGYLGRPYITSDMTSSSPHANTLYIAATETIYNTAIGNNDTAIVVAHSTDGGVSWTSVIADPVHTPSVGADDLTSMIVASDGTLYIAWMRCATECYYGTTTVTYMLSKSTDGGNTWSTPTTIATVNAQPTAQYCPPVPPPGTIGNSGPQFFGCLPNSYYHGLSADTTLGIDNSGGAFNGRLYAIISTWMNTYMGIEVITSSDGGQTWSSPVRVTPLSDVHDQFFPTLAVSKTGVVGVTWLDRRNDPQNLLYREYGAFSTDGGATFTNVELANKASNPNNDGFTCSYGPGCFMGTVTGCTWAGKTFYASWMDSRDGTEMQVYIGGYMSVQ